MLQCYEAFALLHQLAPSYIFTKMIKQKAKKQTDKAILDRLRETRSRIENEKEKNRPNFKKTKIRCIH